MTTLAPYLTFNGNCEEAMNFYASCLNGKIESINRFSEMPDHPAEMANNVMHCEMRAGDMVLMASDAMPGQPVTAGTNITLSIMLTDENQQTTFFNKLAEGGTVTMPLENTFWGARFGMLTDKFGFHWMLNCSQPQAAQ